jgi:Protein of unknown function (DUF4232)
MGRQAHSGALGATAVALMAAAVACGGSTAGNAEPSPGAGTTTSGSSTAATAAPTSVPVAPTAPGGVPNCGTDELRGSLGPAEGAAGSVYVPLVLTNIGGRTCELRGFPGVSYVAGADGHQVGPAAAMSGPRRGEVVLKAGAAAAAQLQLVNVANFDAGVCRPTPVRGLRVYPPGDTTSLFVEGAGTGCAGAPPGNQLSVQTLTPA